MANLKNESKIKLKIEKTNRLPLKGKKASKLKNCKKKEKENANLEKLIKMNSDQAMIPMSYQMQNTYFLGDYIEHNIFGKGIVEAIIEKNKIKITFLTGEKILVHTRKL